MMSEFSVQSFSDGELPADWDSWVCSQKTGSWFHTAEAFCAVWGTGFRLTEIRSHRTGERLAGLIWKPERKFWMIYPKRHPMLYFSSPVFSPEGLSGFADLMPVFFREGLSWYNFNFAYTSGGYPDPALPSSPQRGLWLPVTDPAEQIKKASELVRRNLKKPVSGTFSWISPAELTLQDLALLAKTYGSHGLKSPVSAPELKAILEKVPERSCLALRYQSAGRTLGWRLWLVHPGGWMTDWISAMDREASREPFGYHLVWKSLEKARELGFSALDLGGGNTPGISDFKEKFGCEIRQGLLIQHAPGFLTSAAFRLSAHLHTLRKKI